MGAALRLPPAYFRRQWRAMAVALGPVMMVGAVVAGIAGWKILGVPFWQGALIGAILTPTDPVVAGAIVAGPLAGETLPTRLRRLISGESGANDGIAYPIVFLPVLMLVHPANEALGLWVGDRVVWATLGGAALGAAAGYVAGRAQILAESHGFASGHALVTGVTAFGLALLGLLGLAGADGVLGVFVAGRLFGHVVETERVTEQGELQEIIRWLFTIPNFVLFGAALPWAGWHALGWPGVGLAVAVLLLRRVPVILAARRSLPLDRPADLLFYAWFGPLGVASIFYATLATRLTGLDVVWQASSLVVALSILVHGATATPFLQLYARKVPRELRNGGRRRPLRACGSSSVWRGASGGMTVARARGGLRQVGPEALVLRRRRAGRGFVYLDEKGRQVRDRATLARIRSLAVPPAYEDVQIARDADAHLQAVGRDAAGRVQYRYHPAWTEEREARKVERLGALAAALPHLRRSVARDLARPELCRRRVLAAVISLIDKTHVRIGCEDYVHTGRSRGAATLLKRNVRVAGDRVALDFRGKGGRAIECAVRAPALARTVRALKRQPGPRLFRFRGEDGRLHNLTAADANAYLQEVTGEGVTAKDFRTLAATATAAERLGALEPGPSATARRRQINGVMREIAEMLANTPAVTRKSYVHRRLVDAFERGTLASLVAGCDRPRGLACGEAVVAALFSPTGGTDRPGTRSCRARWWGDPGCWKGTSHAREVEEAADGRGSGALGQARRAQEVEPPRRLRRDGRIDEREGARAHGEHQAQGKADDREQDVEREVDVLEEEIAGLRSPS